MRLRYGRRDGLKSAIEPTIIYLSFSFGLLYIIWPYVYYVKNETIIIIGAFAFWRYGWLVLNTLRAMIYALIAYPALLRRIDRLGDEQRYPKHLYFVIPSYKEESWVTIETFKSIFNELLTIPSHATIIVATSGSEREDQLIMQLYNAHHVRDRVELVLQAQKEGKRIAMGHAIRAISRRYLRDDLDEHSVTFFMDGDSYLEKGFFQKLLPHFAIDPKLGAVTTNEAAFIKTNSNWYKDWFNLKFGQRHLLFQSHSLSKKVLTLTGRLSAYRTTLIIDDEFIRRLENDIITTVMHGKFRFLMGDDKTTWYNLLKEGWNMRYLPDTLCYSLESRDADFLELSRSLPYRWYGNTLRNNNRALALGPRKTGFFIWWAIFDQRISMWTSLVGITGAIVLGLVKSIYYFLFYVAWVLFVRTLQVASIAYNGHIVSWRSLPLMLYGQWIGSLVKIKAFFHLSDQKWSKGGQAQVSDDSVAKLAHPLFNRMPDIMMGASYLLFLFVMAFTHEAFALPDTDVIKHQTAALQRYDAADFGVIPDDGLDDATAINLLIRQCDGVKQCDITLPKGTLDLHHPVLIQTDYVHLSGAGSEATLLRSHLTTEAVAALYVKGTMGKKLAHLKQDAHFDESLLETEVTQKPDWILIRTPNDEAFLHSIGAQRWNKTYPYLRQQIVRATHYDPRVQLLKLDRHLSLDFPAHQSELIALQPIQGVHVSDFTITQAVPQGDIQAETFRYENSHPNYAVDMIRLEIAADATLERLKILNAGRHPIALEFVTNARLEKLYINGAWNKGKSGNGYLRFARTFDSILRDSTIKNIRHITLQWSSAGNRLERLELDNVDINFHGGYSHDNLVSHIRHHRYEASGWDAITYTPLDATYAPPDGPRNRVEHIQAGR
ncbi:MAG: glycosyltransferase [Campylobacterales bacterium]|nr:glycosyltransferase [Campylobacterales bacterium]